MPVDKDSVTMSILILTIPSRVEDCLMPLYRYLLEQVKDRKDVEILCMMDNKSMSIGEKRQALLDSARGKWIGFLDDDDWVSSDYIDSLLEAMRDNPADVITFDQDCMVNDHRFMVRFGWKNPHEAYDPSRTLLLRPPYHMCMWRRKIAKNFRFTASSYGEDIAWISAMLPFVQSETHLDKVLHHYRYSDSTSESIRHAPR